MHLGKDIKEDSKISALVRQWIYLPLSEVGLDPQK